MTNTIYIKDRALTRNRGCGDLVMYGCLVPIFCIIMLVAVCIFAVA